LHKKTELQDLIWDSTAFETHPYEKFREKNTRAATLLLPLNYENDVDTPALQAAAGLRGTKIRHESGA
jgi:hypothetical protein